MEKCLGIFKTNRTMYLDYYTNYWCTSIPWGKNGKDYTILRNGSILKAYKLEELEIVDFDIYNIELFTTRNRTILFKNMKDVHKCSWLSEIKG